jgi:transposase
LEKNHHFLYYDESAFCNGKRTNSTWQIESEENTIYNNGRIKRVNILFMHDNKKPIIEYITYDNVNGDTVMEFMKLLLIKIEEDLELRILHIDKLLVIIVLDNAAYHHTKKLKEFASINNLNLLYFPPFTPTFMPIETIFSLMKRQFYSRQYTNR